MNKKVRTILLSLYIIMLPIAFIVYSNSYNIALKKAGFSKRGITYIDTGIDDNGAEYRAVFQYMPDNLVKIALLTKTNWGTWRITDETQGPTTETGYLSMGWMRFTGFRRYEVSDNVVFELEVHNVYAGNDAIAQIEIPVELLPPNVSVSVFQAGSVYVLHFVTYGDPKVLNEVHFIDLLKQAGCIQ